MHFPRFIFDSVGFPSEISRCTNLFQILKFFFLRIFPEDFSEVFAWIPSDNFLKIFQEIPPEVSSWISPEIPPKNAQAFFWLESLSKFL